jgi:hypothetical protein
MLNMNNKVIFKNTKLRYNLVRINPDNTCDLNLYDDNVIDETEELKNVDISLVYNVERNWEILKEVIILSKLTGEPLPTEILIANEIIDSILSGVDMEGDGDFIYEGKHMGVYDDKHLKINKLQMIKYVIDTSRMYLRVAKNYTEFYLKTKYNYQF